MIFNVGYENQKVIDLATTVANEVGEDVEIEITSTDDNRSYHVSSSLIFDVLGFKAEKSIAEAVRDLLKAFETGSLPDSLNDPKYFNIKMMQTIALL